MPDGAKDASEAKQLTNPLKVEKVKEVEETFNNVESDKKELLTELSEYLKGKSSKGDTQALNYDEKGESTQKEVTHNLGKLCTVGVSGRLAAPDFHPDPIYES